MYIHYPYYHPNRSRFFNTATLFEETVKALQTGMDNYLYQNWNYRRTCDYKSSSLDLSYINYVKWEESGRKELSLSGFFLTNRQIYWIAIAQKMFFKYHSHLKIDKETNLLFENFHLFFKNNYNFRKAFNCLKLTKPEQKEFNKYLEYP